MNGRWMIRDMGRTRRSHRRLALHWLRTGGGFATLRRHMPRPTRPLGELDNFVAALERAENSTRRAP